MPLTGSANGGAPPSGQFEVLRRADPDGVALALQGELDLASSSRLEQELREVEAAKPDRVLIDLRELTFMDSSGLSVLIRARESARAHGHRLALRRGPRQIHRLFQLTGTLDAFKFEN